MRYQLVIRKPITDEDIVEAKKAFPNLSIYDALKAVVDEENELAILDGEGAICSIEEIK